VNVLSPTIQQTVEDLLIQDGVLKDADLALIKQKAATSHQPFFSILLSDGHVSDEQLTKALSKANKIPYVNLSEARIASKVLDLLPQDVAEHYLAVPLGEMQNKLVIAMLDPGNLQAVDFLSNKINRPLKVYAASESGVRRILSQYEHNLEHGITSILDLPTEENNGPVVADKDTEQTSELKKNANVQAIVEDSPVSKALNAILQYAAKNRASDIHIEAQEKEIKIRCRVDGVLREVMRLPKSVEAPLISRIKIISNLKIDEHRIPQDGQFTVAVENQALDIRVAISPVVWGEQVVLRLLDKSGTSLLLEDMGYVGRPLRLLREAIKRPHGMILTSGPTGSGKSTSLYALIQEIKNADINIVTLEDPVEYKMEGINQIQVNPDVGLTFATGLRSILRQDPDVVMVGEIRDKETASLAVQAALTGHLVFSTLHTNSAAGILPRLLDMSIEPFLIASTVHTVIGQRLVRRLISGADTYTSSKAETDAIKATVGSLLPKSEAEMAKVCQDLGYERLPLATQNAYTLSKAKETPDNPTGFKGRMGLYEVFEVTEKIQDLIIKHSPSSIIQKAAQEQGMVSMKQDGYLKALAGLTTLAEVNRVAASDV
jgi:type IV pilus assembly protein PilB